MEIDIISYTEEQMAMLSNDQLLEVREGQVKKNDLERKLADDLRKADAEMLKNGTFQSTARLQKRAKLQADCEAEIEKIRDGLLFYLRYSYRPGSAVSPYPLDYSLNDEQRVAVVKEYYMTTYTDGTERFNAFKEDQYARLYLGELYAPFWHFLKEAMEAGA